MGRDVMPCNSERRKMSRTNAAKVTSSFNCKYLMTDKEHQQSGFVTQTLAIDVYVPKGMNNNMTIKVGAS
jgi:hypothetical protein